jgi:hypothetical protein
MSSSPKTGAFALLWLPSGDIENVIFDRLGLIPGRTFLSMVSASGRKKAERMLRAAATGRSVLDRELSVELASGTTSVFLSAAATSRGIFLIGMKTPVSSSALPKSLVQLVSADPELARALREFTAGREPKARPEQRQGSAPMTLPAGLRPGDTDGAGAKIGGQGKLHWRRMLAHDLRNPVSGILCASQYLMEDAGSQLDTHQMMLLRSIESSCALLMGLIDDRLEAPRASPRKPSLRLQKVDIAWLVEQVALILQRIAPSNKTRLEVEKDETIAGILLDPLKMPLALNVVLANAVHCTPPGGDIEVGIKAERERVVVTVCYNGAENVSEDSVRGSRFTRRQNQHPTARALSSIRRIVEVHGGRVKAQNSARGSLLILTLPRSRQLDGEPRDALEPSTAKSRSRSKKD